MNIQTKQEAKKIKRLSFILFLLALSLPFKALAMDPVEDAQKEARKITIRVNHLIQANKSIIDKESKEFRNTQSRPSSFLKTLLKIFK